MSIQNEQTSTREVKKSTEDKQNHKLFNFDEEDFFETTPVSKESIEQNNQTFKQNLILQREHLKYKKMVLMIIFFSYAFTIAVIGHIILSLNKKTENAEQSVPAITLPGTPIEHVTTTFPERYSLPTLPPTDIPPLPKISLPLPPPDLDKLQEIPNNLNLSPTQTKKTYEETLKDEIFKLNLEHLQLEIDNKQKKIDMFHEKELAYK